MAISIKTKKYVAETYAKYFGKTADDATLDYYGSIGKTSKILKQIRDDANIEQYNVHGNDLQAEVHNAFQNLFSRNAFNIELEKYVKVLQKSKNLPINSIVKKASKFDKDVYRNKQDIAKFVFEKGGAVEEFDLSKVTKANPIDVKSLASLADLKDKIDALPENDFVPTVYDGQSINLTDGQDNFTGTNKNDIFTGSNDSSTPKLNTANSVDILDGKGGRDTLKISADGLAATNIGIPNITNIEIIEVTSTGFVTVDTTSTTGVEDLKVVKASNNVDAEAGSETNITVSGVTSGNIVVDGGKNVTVTDETAGNDITIGATTVAKGNITITDTKVGAAEIKVDGGVNVTITATGSDGTVATDTIEVGTGGAATDLPTGIVTVTSNAASVAATDEKLAAIKVSGGSSIVVNQVASSTAAATDTAGSTITMGAVEVDAGNATTSITVNQTKSTAEVLAVDAVAEVAATKTLTFSAINSGQTVVVDGLTFKASKDLTAEQVAAAFANLTASDTQDKGGITANGTYSGTISPNWTSAAANGAVVVFSETVAGGAIPTLTVNTGSGTAPTVVTSAAGTAATPATTGVLGVINGTVVIDDNATASVTTVTVDGYGASSTIGATTTMAALTTVSLANSGGATAGATNATMDIDAAGVETLALTVNNINGTVDIDEANDQSITTLNLTSTGEASTFGLEANGVVTMTIAAAADLDVSTSSDFSALTTVTITGTGAVALGDVSAKLATLNASAAKGAISAEVDGTLATVTTGSGDDVITVNSTTVTQAITLGAGDDRLDLSALNSLTGLAAISGGADTDTVVLDGTQALVGALSSPANSAIFKDKVTGFEKLEISTPVAGTVSVGNLGYNYVIVGASNAALILADMANNGTLELTGALTVSNLTVSMKDASGTADTFNIVANGVSVTAGQSVVVANVERINIDAKNNSDINLTAAAAKTITVKGEYDLDLDTGATTHANLKTVDASKLEGDLTFTINSSVTKFALTSGKGNDTIIVSTSDDAQVKTGLGADEIIIQKGAVSANIWGGAGNDIFDVTNAISSENQYVTIEDATSGDQIKLGTAKFLSGDITITDFDQMTLTDKFKAVLGNTTLNDANSTGFAISFQHAKNTYIIVSDGNGAINLDPATGTDQVIKLTGLIDLGTGASFNAGATTGTLEIA